VAQVRDEHRRTEPDAFGPQRRERGVHPDVGIERRRVEEPRPLIAEMFGEDDVLDDTNAGRKRTGDLHGRACYERRCRPGESGRVPVGSPPMGFGK
jgi:hypothetical protein